MIGQRLTWWAWTPRLLCDLAWRHFDGFEFTAECTDDIDGLFEAADSTGLLVVFTPWEYFEVSWLDDEHNRAHYSALGTDSAFIRTEDLGSQIEEIFTSSEMQDELQDMIDEVTDSLAEYDALWCWKLWDEAPTAQRGRLFDETHDFDEYIPDMFLLDDLSDSVMTSTDSASVYSWMKWIIEQADGEHPVTTVFAGMPKISSTNDWAGYHHGPGVPYAATHADIVRAYSAMRYQDYPMVYPSVHDNYPEMLQVDIYSFRHVGTEYQDEEAYAPTLGDSLYTWLLDHAETGMDSTFLPALWVGLDLHYFVQAFGAAGGDGMWRDTIVSGDTLTVISYNSYLYRIPTPSEFRMLANLSLMRQAKGIFPYSLQSYPEGDIFAVALLDIDMIPWDAPFEEYCYRTRAQDSLTYIRPDSIPPFLEGFDPLYEGPGEPPSTTGERARQDFLEWKFAPYGRLWESTRETLGDVAIIAPELAGLEWWGEDGSPDAYLVDSLDGPWDTWAGPENRVFQDAGEEHEYLFYVNRCCSDSSHVFGVWFEFGPLYPPSDYALDHTRRFIIPQVDLDSQEFSYYDTLGPGECRLVELVDDYIPAELRITSPDVFSRHQGSLTDRHEHDYTAGDTVEVYGVFYNLGTEEAEDVEATITDLTTETALGRDTLDFEGLDLDGYLADADTAGFVWATDAGDIGIHLVRLEAERQGGEDRLDNSVVVPFLIGPRDYATEVRGDPWDMTEATSAPPAWKTNDIEDVSGCWASSAWTDSVGGMFEGAIDPNGSSPHRADISLTIPAGRDDWIDADIFHLLSFAGTWFTPYEEEYAQCDMYAGWRDADGDWSGWVSLGSPAGLLKNGWSNYRVVQGIDLSTTPSWTGLIQELWIRIESEEPGSPQIQLMPVRLGWVRLEEVAE